MCYVYEEMNVKAGVCVGLNKGESNHEFIDLLQRGMRIEAPDLS